MKNLIQIFLNVFLILLTFNLVACENLEETFDPLNKLKPIVYFDSLLVDENYEEINKEPLKLNENTYFVGGSYQDGGILQGELIVDYLNEHIKDLDKDQDHVLGYLLAIGSETDLKALNLTEGVRKALGTYTQNGVKEGSLKINNEDYKIVELDSKIMRDVSGDEYNYGAALETMKMWGKKYDKELDFLVSNDDNMAFGLQFSEGYKKGTPIFGYDGKKDMLISINKGEMSGSISLNLNIQAYTILQLFRNIFDGLKDSLITSSGFMKPDIYGNKLKTPLNYQDKTFTIPLSKITKANALSFLTLKEIKQTTAPLKKVLVIIHDRFDTLMAFNYQEELVTYSKLLNIDLDFVYGEEIKGYKLNNYDGYAINTHNTELLNYYLEMLK